MYRSTNLILSSIGLIVSSICPVQAGVETIKTELLAVSLGGAVPGYFYLNGKDNAKMTAFSQGISPPAAYAGPPVLKFYKDLDSLKSAKGDDSSPEPIVSVSIPAGGNRTLLVFDFTTNKEVPDLKAYGIKDAEFGAGDYRIFNLSGKTIHAVLHDKDTPVEVPAGEQVTVKAEAWGKDVQSIQATFSLNSDSSVKPVYSSVWGHRPERRSFIFVSGEPGIEQRLKIAKFFDVPSVKAMKPQPLKDGR